MAASYQIRSILHQAEEVLQSQRGGRRRSGSGDAAERGRAKKTSLEDNILTSVRTVERAVESFGALKENCQYYKEMAHDLRRELDEEKGDHQVASKQIDELEHHLRSERDRTLRLEDLLAAADAKLQDLERELETVRDRTEHLVETISRLVSAEADSLDDRDQDYYRQAA